MNFKIPLENASRLLWTILSISKNDDDVLLSAVSHRAYYATAWFFFSSHFPRKRTPHALFSNSSSHQKSSRRVSSGAVGIALAAQSPVLSPLAVAAAQRQFWCALCRFCSFSWDTLECRTSEGLLILYFIGKVRNKCFYWGLRRSNHGPRVERFTYDFFSFGLFSKS